MCHYRSRLIWLVDLLFQTHRFKGINSSFSIHSHWAWSEKTPNDRITFLMSFPPNPQGLAPPPNLFQRLQQLLNKPQLYLNVLDISQQLNFSFFFLLSFPWCRNQSHDSSFKALGLVSNPVTQAAEIRQLIVRMVCVSTVSSLLPWRGCSGVDFQILKQLCVVVREKLSVSSVEKK